MPITRTKQLGSRRQRFARALDARIDFLHVPKCGGNSVRLGVPVDAFRDALPGFATA